MTNLTPIDLDRIPDHCWIFQYNESPNREVQVFWSVANQQAYRRAIDTYSGKRTYTRAASVTSTDWIECDRWGVSVPRPDVLVRRHTAFTTYISLKKACMAGYVPTIHQGRTEADEAERVELIGLLRADGFNTWRGM